MRGLAIILEEVDPLLWRVARRLRTYADGPAKIVVSRAQSARSDTPQVFLARASMLTPAVSVRWSVGFPSAPAAQATERALSSAAWDASGPFELWRALSRTPPRSICIGRPDFERDWVITSPRAWTAAKALERTESVQLHCLGLPLSDLGGGVVWWPSSRAAAYLLGRAVALVDTSGPLAFDAMRSGVPVFDPLSLARTLAPQVDERLAGLVPASLIDSERLWRHVVLQTHAVAEGRAPEPLCTAQWIALGRAAIAERPHGRLERARRKVKKFWREPESFFADSRYSVIRAIGSSWPAGRR